LGEYVRALLDALAVGDPAGYTRMRTVVTQRRATIQVDEEVIEVVFDGPAFRVETQPTGAKSPGRGVTSRETVVALLRGQLEVREAITLGRLDVLGTVDDTVRMFHAIQILVDSATRVPRIQQLARDYVADPCLPIPSDRARHWDDPQGHAFSIRPLPPTERAMLARLDLLP